MENFKFLIDSFMEYSSKLKGQVEKEVETSLAINKLLDIIEKCASTHNKVEESLKDVQAYEEEAKTLFLYWYEVVGCHKIIKDSMDAIETQISNASNAYDLVHDRDD